MASKKSSESAAKAAVNKAIDKAIKSGSLGSLSMSSLSKTYSKAGGSSSTAKKIASGSSSKKDTRTPAQIAAENAIDAAIASGNLKNLDIGDVKAAYTSAGGVLDEKTQEEIDAAYEEELKKNNITAAMLFAGNTAEQLAYAASTGDLSGLKDSNGMPFSLADQQAALKKAEEDNARYFEEKKAKETADAEALLQTQQQTFKDYLLSSGESFEKEKSDIDQTAANQGVLFSGGRAQKEAKLASTYESDQASKLASIGSNISNAARDYQYKYGNENASSSNLSSLYKLGKNVYNPKVARGGVSSGGLSSVYNPSSYDFYGTELTAKKAEEQKRAANYLYNKGNKLVA